MAAALILAGGASSRMGRDKAAIVVAGQPLLARVLASVAPRCRPIVVAARAGQVLPAVAVAYERVDDPPALVGGGPLVGIVAGLERLAARGAAHAYLGSCDAIGLGDDHVAFMLAELDADPHASVAIVRDRAGRLHPLAAAVRVGPVLAHARAALDAGERRLQRVFATLPAPAIVEPAALPRPEALAPCNTPAQLDGYPD